MGAGEERRKLLCQCGKPLGIFTAQGLELYCRFSKESTTVPYPIGNLEESREGLRPWKPGAMAGAQQSFHGIIGRSAAMGALCRG
jgi:hypothetical protein